MHRLLALLLVLLLASCSMWPFNSKKSPDADTKGAAKTAAAQKVEESQPQPGDIRVVDGIEYIYAKNVRYMASPWEPQYVWIRKDQYSPGLFEGLRSTPTASTKEQKEMEQRIAKLEEDLKKKGITQQMAYPPQVMYLPQGVGSPAPLPMVSFNYPSPRMKRRVVVLPLEDQTNFKSEHLGGLATQRLISKLESTNTVICVDPATIALTGSLADPNNMKPLNRLYGVHAVISGTLSDVYTSTAKVESMGATETSFALSRISLSIFNTDTGTLLRQLIGRNPVFLSREKGEMSPEKAKVRAIDIAIELIAEDALRAILSLDWHARIASIEQQKIYLTAGRLSGLEKGDVLDVYTQGESIIDSATKAPLGTTKGELRGQVEVVELFGVDAASATAKSGSGFTPTDFVYLKK
jgi:hypothetical protein